MAVLNCHMADNPVTNQKTHFRLHHHHALCSHLRVAGDDSICIVRHVLLYHAYTQIYMNIYIGVDMSSRYLSNNLHFIIYIKTIFF